MSVVTVGCTAVGPVPADPVRAVQHAPYRAAKTDPGRRFHPLRGRTFQKLPDDRADVARRAGEIRDALAAGADEFLQACPGQVRLCDPVVAVPVLAGSWSVAPVSGLGELVAGWTARTRTRASSPALMLAFLSDIDPRAAADHRRFVGAFVVREPGLVGVGEYPVGTDDEGDVDSGSLIAGVSLSASDVALGAAHPQGDTAVAATLDAEAELFGLPVAWFDGRRNALGLLPVADTLLAWWRAQPAVTGGAGPVDRRQPQ